jgi:hypothetical protein
MNNLTTIELVPIPFDILPNIDWEIPHSTNVWIFNGSHEWFRTCGKVSIMIPPCTTSIHSNPPISIENLVTIHYAHIQVEMFHWITIG